MIEIEIRAFLNFFDNKMHEVVVKPNVSRKTKTFGQKNTPHDIILTNEHCNYLTFYVLIRERVINNLVFYVSHQKKKKNKIRVKTAVRKNEN